jgi:hypothetical protein
MAILDPPPVPAQAGREKDFRAKEVVGSGAKVKIEL